MTPGGYAAQHSSAPAGKWAQGSSSALSLVLLTPPLVPPRPFPPPLRFTHHIEA